MKDFIHMTKGEFLLKYWYLYLIIICLILAYGIYLNKKYGK